MAEKYVRRAACTMLVALVAGCSSGGEPSPILAIARSVVPAIGQVPGLGEPAAPAEPGFAVGDIAANPDNYRLMLLPILGDGELGRRIVDNGNSETWLSQGGYTAAYVDGILVATRGLGHDLFAADVRGLRAAIAAGGGTTRRVHDILGDLDQIISESLDCTVATEGQETVDLGTRQVNATKVTETCRGTRTGFTNTYWLDGGSIISSLQFVSIEVNYLRIARL